MLAAAALHLSLSPEAAPSDARLCLRMGFTSVRELARVLAIPYDPDPRPDTPISVTEEEFAEAEFAEAVALLEEIGFPTERSAVEAWADFRGWRVNYEAVAFALGDLVTAPPALWSGPRRHVREEAMSVQRPVDRRPEEPEGVGPTTS